MSTDITPESLKPELTLTSFWGGEGLGCCVQITCGYVGGLARITVAQVNDLQATLAEWLKEALKEERLAKIEPAKPATIRPVKIELTDEQAEALQWAALSVAAKLRLDWHQHCTDKLKNQWVLLTQIAELIRLARQKM